MSEIKIRIITYLTLLIFIFIAGTAFRYFYLISKNIEYSVASISVINRNIMKNWETKTENFYTSKSENVKFCIPKKQYGWFEKYSFQDCQLIGDGASSLCNFWTIWNICFPLSMPKEYFEDELFMAKLKQSIKTPCKIFKEDEVFESIKYDNYAKIAYDLYLCKYINDTRYFKIYISIYDHKAEQLNLGRNVKNLFKKKIYKVIYFDWNIDAFVERKT